MNNGNNANNGQNGQTPSRRVPERRELAQDGKMTPVTSAAKGKGTVTAPEKKKSPAPSPVKQVWSKKKYKEENGNTVFDFEYFGRALTQIFIAVGALCLVIYFGYHLVDTMTDTVTTATVAQVKETEYREAEGYIFRQEKVISSKTYGTADYYVADGGRVAAGEKICGIYPDAPEGLREQIAGVDREIALLEKSVSHETVSVSIKDAVASVGNDYAEVMRRLATGDWAGAIDISGQFRSDLDRVAYMSGEGSSIPSRISLLISQRAALVSSMGKSAGNVTSSGTGYFYRECDGYEQAFSQAVKDGITPETFENAVSSSPVSTAGTVGKLASDPTWYFAMKVAADDFRGFVTGNKYRLVFTDNGNVSLDMTLDTLTDTGDGTLLMVFSSDRHPENFTWHRRQSVKIEYSVHEGYRIPVSAIHSYEGMTGVYTLHGGYVYFRKINILYESEGYCIVSRYEDIEPGKPETYYVLGFDPEGRIGSFTRMREFSRARGFEEISHGAGAIPVVRGRNFVYYYYLNDLENIIIKGNDLYHGKVLS